ncbi:MAG: signal peptide peptidase SppA [Azoarcus sp.]|jgi:protease-4|nr:signal peptide peptidase SppA [Azoarcus sp.]
MIGGLFSLIAGFFRLLWRFVDAVRRIVFNLILLAILIAVVLVWLHPDETVPRGAALVLRPSGQLVEQTTMEPSLAQLFAEGREQETKLADLIDAVHAAKEDSRIKMLVLETDDLDAASLSKLAELRAAIADFRGSGKPVLARGERFEQGTYYLASIADEIHLAPDGFVLLPGLAAYNTYFRDALDKLGVKMHVFRVGEYKSAVEPFVRNDMSEEDRAATLELLDGLWKRLREDIIAARKLTPEGFDDYVTHFDAAMKAANGDTAKAAQTAGLIDRFSTRDEWRARIVESLGKKDDGKDFTRIDARKYLAVVKRERKDDAAKIAVLVAQGAIVEGVDTSGAAVDDSFAKLLRAARENAAVKAVVVRIDSPGGSAWASEVIRAELELIRKAGKPVVASMSSVAASGGYWIATGADEIVAEPSTLTGSIGIFGLLPEFSQPLAKLGLNVDGVATAPLAAALDPRRPLAPEAADILQLSIEDGYRRFLDVVAKARNMKPEEVDAIARGRVWSGEEASKRGLVDRLGGLDSALDAAASRAKLKNYTVVWPKPEVAPMRQLLRQFFAFDDEPGVLAPSQASRVVDRLVADLKRLTLWNDPRHIYAHCLCEAP